MTADAGAPPSRRIITGKRVLLLFGAALVAGGGGLWYAMWHHRAPSGPPPRATEMAVPPAISSTIAVPLSSDLGVLQRLLEQEIPQDLWTIDQPGATCAQPQKVRLFGADIGVTPKLKCHIVGVARRGAITLHGQGQVIVADLPITADVRAENVGGLVNAHATGSAMAHARISLSLSPDWHAHGKIALAYDWSTPPGIDLLGQRVTFTDKADEKLKPLIAKLQAKLPEQLDKLNLRQQVQGLWAKGFTVLNLNQDNPPVWMRIVPQRIDYGGYTIAGNRLTLNLGMVALTQAIVGQRPADPAPTPLPAMGKASPTDQQVKIFAPVLADYDQLVPVLDKALAKRSAKPFVLPGIGPVTASFGNIEVFGASKGRIAVGADVTASAGSGAAGATHGRIWFAAKPDNADGSQLVHFTDLSVSGGTDNAGGDLLLAIANSPGFSGAVADALQQNFARDYNKLIVKIQRAIDERQQGDFRIKAHLAEAKNGRMAPYANGLYMPVWLRGQASIAYAPGGKGGK
ncbi:DUF4403 family protein [Novosphingobium rosa]|uniref:DUF4403 family protein n=1 Tax=Novosphingobium rosa TaxID=76978 RepID=UPI00082FC656|nr:DUF4403 family protein [Novosphingobium rosa]